MRTRLQIQFRLDSNGRGRLVLTDKQIFSYHRPYQRVECFGDFAFIKLLTTAQIDEFFAASTAKDYIKTRGILLSSLCDEEGNPVLDDGTDVSQLPFSEVDKVTDAALTFNGLRPADTEQKKTSSSPIVGDNSDID